MADFINPALGYVAQQNFVCDGVNYRSGDTFNADGLNERDIERLWRYRLIRNGDGEAPEPVAQEVSEVPPVVDEVPPVVDEVPLVVDDPTAESGPIFTDTGAGWYNILVGGYVVNERKLKGRAAAEEWAKANGYV